MNRHTAIAIVASWVLAVFLPGNSSAGMEFDNFATVEVVVTANGVPVSGASVALDFNRNSNWEEYLGEPRDITGSDGLVVFSDVVSVRDHNSGGGVSEDGVDCGFFRILASNLRGAVGGPEVHLDFVAPPWETTASLALYDLRGFQIAKTQSSGDLFLDLQGRLQAGIYVLHLGAGEAGAFSHKITSIGSGPHSITARRTSHTEALAEGWGDPGITEKTVTESAEQEIILIVDHPEFDPVFQTEIIYPGQNSLSVNIQGTTPAPEFVYITPGYFTMGSPLSEWGRYLDETQHQVTLTHGFYCQTTEVTNQQYMEMAQWAYDHGYVTATSSTLCDNLDGSVQELLDLDSPYCEIEFSEAIFSCVNLDHPVQEVTWYGSATYCDWLSLQQGLPRAYDHSNWQCNGGNPYTANGYRLPTEAEWEYACRAGSTTAFANGAITQINCSPLDPNLDVMGWYCGNAGGWTHPVGQTVPNSWGLFDMHGNLFEWCNDWLAAYDGTVTNPPGPGMGAERVRRGGCWFSNANNCRSAHRDGYYPEYSYSVTGFRPVKSSD